MKPIDKQILDMLERTKPAQLGGMWIKGATIARNIDKNSDYINSRLRRLNEEGYVETDDRGYYRITSRGSQYITS